MAPVQDDIGCRVVLAGLQFTPQYNGEIGRLEHWIDSSNRFQVRLGGKNTNLALSLKPENLRITDAPLAPPPPRVEPPPAAPPRAGGWQGQPAYPVRKGKGSGKGQAAGLAACLRCKACNVESSGEESFMQHIVGKAHTRRARRSGFAGLIPNSMGVIPPLINPMLRHAAAQWGLDPGGMSVPKEALPPWSPPARDVNVPYDVLSQAKDALDQTSNLHHGDDRRENMHRRAGEVRILPPPPPLLRGGGPMAAQRDALPVSKHRDELLGALGCNVSIVEGETGSGKTTQVAQFLLEDAALRFVIWLLLILLVPHPWSVPA